MKPVKKEKKEIIWVLVYTKAKEEKKANENLQRQGFKTFLPLIAPTNQNSEFKSLVPVFPRYLFAQINFELDNWTAIKSSYGVSNIVMFSEKFTSIPNNIIQLIQDKLNEEGLYKEDVAIVDYQKGDPVSIKEGGFAGIDAIFLSKKSKDRVRLLLKLLNASVVAEIATSDIDNKEVVKNFKL
jgi:transcriptional antiterminator RfaH